MKQTLVFVIIPVLFLIKSCDLQDHTVGNLSPSDFNQMVKKGKLIVATGNNNTDYFLYQGEPMGFQFEMLQDLGNYLGVKVEVLVCNEPSENIALLKNGDCDILASSLNFSEAMDSSIVNSVSLIESDLLLVQRKAGDLLFGVTNSEYSLITDVRQLEGKSVYVPLKSAQAHLLSNLNKDLSGNVHVHEMPQYTQEKLVELVSSGDLDYTICNSMVAKSLSKIYPDLDFNTVVKKSEPIVWNFRKTSPVLVAKINAWLTDYTSSVKFAQLTDKYFNDNSKLSLKNRYTTVNETQISAFDDLIKKYSSTIDWDWRLLASLIYQESRFKPSVRSRRGAWGLMQLMPSTQHYFGIDSTASPEKQIAVGVRYIQFLDKEFARQIADPEERIHFILASYNIGPGHILDAQKIALKVGKDPNRWFNSVDSCLLSKSDPKHYSDPNIQFGYCKGTETYNFVQEIIARYNHYKNVVPVSFK
jgi:membrane-bound lytic murein transglycosylase F